jgi:two-component system sensor histidine kinase HydH
MRGRERRRVWLGYVPGRVAASAFGLFVLLLAVAVVAGIGYERHRLGGGGGGDGLAGLTWPADDGLAAGDTLKVLIALLVLAAVGILALTTTLNYRAITRTFERMKSLMGNVLQSIPTGVVTLDSRGVVTSLNDAAERLLGLRASAVVGRGIEDGLQTVSDLVAWIQRARQGAQRLQETDLSLTLEDGRRVTVRASASELRDESGRADGWVVLLRDITEVSRLEAQLRRADKLAALGTLAAGVAHEVKNPLHALSLNLHLLRETVHAPRPSPAERDEYFEILRSEVQRIERIVENFLRFAKPAIPEVKPLDLHALLERVLSLVAFEAADHGVTIETDFTPALGPVAGDEGQLSQVFLNLCINALQAMPDGGSLVVTTRAADGWADVLVRDTGEGIQKDVLPHVFDPYFTTRPRGAGLGLAIAHRIVEGHRGTIDVESEVGMGTTMIVRLPLMGGVGEGS